MSTGFWYGAAAYGIWGLFPIYWRLFPNVPAMQVLAHRIVWSFLVLVVVVSAGRRGGLHRLRAVPQSVVVQYAMAAGLIGVNWFLFVWAVNHGYLIETSLGYFITPLVNVLMGVLVFREPLRPLQWLAVALATGGVLHLTFAYGALPKIAIGLALSWGCYALIKKRAPLPPVDGLTLETAVLFLPALVYLAAAHVAGDGAFFTGNVTGDGLLVGGGIITIGPLLLFAAAVQRIPLSLVGILQYIAPTIQFVLGVFVYREAFAASQLVGFSIVWTALVLFTADGLFARRHPGAVPVVEEPL